MEELNDTLGQLRDEIENLKKRIKNLEVLQECEICSSINVLHICYYCGNNACRKCTRFSERKDYRGETRVIQYCKECDNY